MDRPASGAARAAAIVSCTESALAPVEPTRLAGGASAGAMGPADDLSAGHGLFASGNAPAEVGRANR